MGKSWKNHGARVVHPQSAVCPATGLNRKDRCRGKSRGLESVLDPLQQAQVSTDRWGWREMGVLLCTYRLEALTFCHSMMRMMSEMTVRTTKARMAEITTTLKGRAKDRDQSSLKQTAAGSCSLYHAVGIQIHWACSA